MDARQRLYRQSKSDNPDIAFPALVKLGLAREILPTTDTGYKTYGTGRLFLPSATNYCTNPSFAGGDTGGLASGWIDSHTTADAPAFSIVSGRTDAYAQRFTLASAADSNKVATFAQTTTAVGSFAQNDYATFSCYIKGTASAGITSVVIALSFRQAGGSSTGVGSTSAVTLTTGWQRVSLTVQGTADTTSRAYGYISVTGIDGGESFDITIDDALLEKSAVLTPYFDGTYPNCAWTGTANASTSTRTVSALTVPTSLGAVGWTVAGRYSGIWAHNDSAAHNLLTLYAASDARATVYKHTDNKLYASVTDGTDTVTSASAASTLAANTVNTFVASATWASTVDISINGVASAQGDASAVAAQTIDSIALGASYDYVGPLILSPTNKGAAWQAAIQANSGAAYSSPMRLWRDFMSAGDVIFPLRGDSKGYKKLVGVGSVA